jgi:copper chaperone CopZ
MYGGEGRRRPVQTVRLVISKLDGSGEAGDLANTIIGISGVAGVSVDLGSHIVSIEYDPAFVSPKLVQQSIEGAGYPVDSIDSSAVRGEGAP